MFESKQKIHLLFQKDYTQKPDQSKILIPDTKDKNDSSLNIMVDYGRDGSDKITYFLSPLS